MKVELVESVDALRAREAEWQQLYRHLPAASVFTSPTWVLNWIASFAADAPLRCLFLSDESGLQAVLPLVPVSTRWRRLPLVALTPCTNPHSVRSALLFDPAQRDEVFSAALETLRKQSGWDMLLLDGCDAGSGLKLPPLPEELEPQAWQHSCLAVQGSWDEYFATRSRDLRRNLRRAETDLAALGQIAFTVNENDPERLFAEWVQVDRASWKAEHGETIDANAQTTAYYRSLLQGFAAQGQLCGGVLSLDDAPIAVVICARDKGTLYTLKTAIRAEMSSARLSLGAVVMARMLASQWARPDLQLIDFVSKQSYTERWTSEVLHFERRALFATSWRGHIASLLDRSFQILNKRSIQKRRSPALET